MYITVAVICGIVIGAVVTLMAVSMKVTDDRLEHAERAREKRLTAQSVDIEERVRYALLHMPVEAKLDEAAEYISEVVRDGV